MANRIFLADGDVMLRPFEQLKDILTILNKRFPRLARIGVYANGSSIAAKSDEELRTLRSLKLHTLYMGLESGDEEILKRCNKGETADKMVDAARRAQDCRLRISVMILIGLGGQEHSIEHARHTAETVNRMQPRLLSALRVIPVEGTELNAEILNGQFRQLTEDEAIKELIDLISQLEMKSTVFRANHRSNVVPLEGRLPHDKEQLLAQLRSAL